MMAFLFPPAATVVAVQHRQTGALFSGFHGTGAWISPRNYSACSSLTAAGAGTALPCKMGWKQQFNNPHCFLPLVVCSAQPIGTEAEAAADVSPASAQPFSSSVEDSVSLLKKAAKTRKVPPTEVFAAIRDLEMAKLDPSNFLATIGGSPDSPGPRTWMLIFTASKQTVLDSAKGGAGGGSYFPITAVQKFDATAMTIENGVYLGPLGFLTFQGRISWKNRILPFIFECINIKIGSLGPFKFDIRKKQDEGRTPTTKDPFFIWFYADEEIIVAKGGGGGVAFWCRCVRVEG